MPVPLYALLDDQTVTSSPPVTVAYSRGFLRDTANDTIQVTTNATGATYQGGFLRSPTGELVVTTAPGSPAYRGGFLRDANGALVVNNGGSGTVSGGWLRDTSGALIVGSGTPVLSGGFGRDTSGRLVVAGLTQQSLQLSGTGDFASTPSNVGLQNAVDYRVWAQLNNWASGAVQKLLGKWNTGTGGYLLEIDATGTVTFALNTGGTQIFTTSSPLGLANGSLKWVRATWNAATGQAIIYTSDDGSTWTTVQTFAGSAAGAASNAEAVTVGADAGAAQPVTGKIYRATLLSSIGGATVGDFNPGAVTRTGVRTPTTYTDPQGNVWTVNGTGWDWV
jgi:hypothetical protein